MRQTQRCALSITAGAIMGISLWLLLIVDWREGFEEEL